MTPLRVLSMLACFVLFSLSALAQSEPFTIGMRDACDPGTFSSPVNAAGPGACKPGQHGTTKFKFFIAELQSDMGLFNWRQSASIRGRRPHCKTQAANSTPSPRSQLSAEDSFHHSISCREIRFRLLSACNQKTRQIYSLKPVLLMPDRQQARLNFRLALAIGNAVSTPGCG